MICFKNEITLTQNECSEIKQAYLKYCTKEKGWQISETTTTITFTQIQWFGFNKGKPEYNDDLYEDWMMFDKEKQNEET